MGHQKDRIFNPSYKPISILYGQTLFDKQQLQQFIPCIEIVGESREGLGSYKS